MAGPVSMFCTLLLGTGASSALAAPVPTATTSGAIPPVEIRNGELPAVSQDGAYVAFESDRLGPTGLYVIRSDGSREREIARAIGESGPLAWTKGGRLLFSNSLGNSAQLVELDRNGGNRRIIATVPGRSPRLSPDGRQIVFMGGTYTETKLMVCNIVCTTPRQISDGLSPAWNPQWSPAGTRIAFTGRDRPGGRLTIFVVNADGTERTQVANFPENAGNAQWPMWSPDGTKLAVQVNRASGGDAHIWLIDVATLKINSIAGHDRPYLDETPSWFPDGKRLAIQSNRTGRMEIWVINTDGSAPRQLTHWKIAEARAH